MIIYGSKIYGVKNVVHGFGECPHCGVYGKHRSYDGRKFGHIYFIPLFPVGGHLRVMKECSNCKMGSHMPRARVGELYQRIESMMQQCVLAATEGQRTFSDPQGGEAHNGPFLLESVDLLYTAGHRDEVPELLGLLDTDASRYEHGLASGAYAELRGDAAAAYDAYASASQAAPDQALPLMILADFQSRVGRAQEALALIERAESLAPDDIQVMLAKAGPLEALGRFQELSDLLDHAVHRAPQLANDKKFSKLRKKYAKKAAKAGR